MKKVLLGLSLGAVMLFAYSCKKDNEENCVDSAKHFQEAYAKYENSPTVENCKAMTAAAKSYSKSDCVKNLPSDQKEVIVEFSEQNCEEQP